MPRHGWLYLTVDCVKDVWTTSDGTAYGNEKEMFDQLGKPGWELILIRQMGDRARYYFKRSRT